MVFFHASVHMVLFFTRTVHNLYFSSLQLLHNDPGGVGPSYLLDKALRALEADSCLPMFIGFIEFDGFVGFIGVKPPSYSREQTLHAQRTRFMLRQVQHERKKSNDFNITTFALSLSKDKIRFGQ